VRLLIKKLPRSYCTLLYWSGFAAVYISHLRDQPILALVEQRAGRVVKLLLIFPVAYRDVGALILSAQSAEIYSNAYYLSSRSRRDEISTPHPVMVPTPVDGFSFVFRD
jgi:hypothetical protein